MEFNRGETVQRTIETKACSVSAARMLPAGVYSLLAHTKT